MYKCYYHQAHTDMYCWLEDDEQVVLSAGDPIHPPPPISINSNPTKRPAKQWKKCEGMGLFKKGYWLRALMREGAFVNWKVSWLV
jgi:hypothetical protein